MAKLSAEALPPRSTSIRSTPASEAATFVGWRDVAVTDAPALLSALLTSRPIPACPPVTTTFLPAKSMPARTSSAVDAAKKAAADRVLFVGHGKFPRSVQAAIRATASAPAASRIGQDGSVAAGHTASVTSTAWVIEPSCWKFANTVCASLA